LILGSITHGGHILELAVVIKHHGAGKVTGELKSHGLLGGIVGVEGHELTILESGPGVSAGIEDLDKNRVPIGQIQEE
jgi:hypothetical protein